MPEYRSRNKRQFFKLHEDTGVTVSVVNMLFTSNIEVSNSEFVRDDVFGKYPVPGILPCTEEEFNAAKSEAMKRLNEEKI